MEKYEVKNAICDCGEETGEFVSWVYHVMNLLSSQ